MFFFWILIYIEKEEKMKISCNRVTGVFLSTRLVGGFCQPVWWGFLVGFLGSFCQGFLSTIWLGIFVGFLVIGDFWYIHGYLIRYIFFDKERSSKDKRKGTMQYKVLYYTF